MREAEYAERVREAEMEMAEAARRLAELSSQRLPEIRDMQLKMLELDHRVADINDRESFLVKMV